MTTNPQATPQSPRTPSDAAIARGRLIEQGGDDLGLWIDFAVPGTELRLRLRVAAPLDVKPGQRIAGEIKAVARRVDIVGSGGRLIEPVYGRPRRIQGRIVGGRTDANAIVVLAAGVPIVATLASPGQRVAGFSRGQLAAFDVEPGARFEPRT